MTTETTIQTYKTRATAVRGANRKGFTEKQITIGQDADGLWFWTPTTQVATGEYKTPKLDRGGPVAQIWSFLASNEQMTRKEQIAALIAAGHKPNTVKTQTSRFYVKAAQQDANNDADQGA